MKGFFVLSTSLLISALTLWGGELAFTGTTDKAVALYQPGEKMVFGVQLLDDGKPMAGKNLQWRRTGDDAQTETGKAVSSETEPLTVSTTLETPGFVRIEVWAVDEQDNPLVDAKNKPVRFDGGAGVEVEKLEGIPEPTDFDEFWTKQKVRLAEVPLKFTLTEVPSTTPGFVVYDVKIDCAGGKPVSGYFTKPKNAAPKSLKAQIGFMGYGVASASPGYAAGTLTLNINAHGIENSKDAAYYENLKNGELKGYAFKNDENAKPETAYFNGMILRVLRALEFLKAQPEWNGKDLTATGGSQGGFQALAAAALDKDVSVCVPSIPWCCDLGGIKLGRLRGWRPDYTDGLGYYDAANMAKRIHCETRIIAGLGDYVCPPSGVCVLYNNLKAPKQLELLQGKTHPYTPPNPQKITLSSH
ncbi:MAG: acetylxylan esterase [Chthoniobacteraceae bacterium]